MNDELTPNTPLLRKTLEWAENEAAKPQAECGWYQGSYVRPVVHLGGVLDQFFDRSDETYEKSVEINGCGTAFCIAGYVYWQGTGNLGHDVSGGTISTYAERALGLNNDQACLLFAGNNSIERIRELMEAFAGERL